MLVICNIRGKDTTIQIELSQYVGTKNLCVNTFIWSQDNLAVPGYWKPGEPLSVETAEFADAKHFAVKRGDDRLIQFARLKLIEYPDLPPVTAAGSREPHPVCKLTHKGNQVAHSRAYANLPSSYRGKILC